MSTRHVILGLLREQPGHTYDVAIRFGRRLQPWQLNRGQVYSVVTALEAEGLIETIGENDVNARSGPPWRLTPDGLRELDRWFATRSEDVEPLRGELLAKFAVASAADAAQLLVALDWYERALVAELAKVIQRKQDEAADSTCEWTGQLAECIADGAILHHDAELIWVRRVRELVQTWNTQAHEQKQRTDTRHARAS